MARVTAGAYLKAADIAVRLSGKWGRHPPAKPANEASADSEPILAPSRNPTASACEPNLDFIEISLGKGLNAKAIYHDLVDDHGFTGRYQSVKRFVRQLRGTGGSWPQGSSYLPIMALSHRCRGLIE